MARPAKKSKSAILDALDSMPSLQYDPNIEGSSTSDSDSGSDPLTPIDDDCSQDEQSEPEAHNPIANKPESDEDELTPPTVNVKKRKRKGRKDDEGMSITLTSDEPWNMVKAQLLVKIDLSLKPKALAITDYNIMYHILRVLPKPGIHLSDNSNYEGLLECVHNLTSKIPTMNITIIERSKEEDKENVVQTGEVGPKEEKKKKNAKRDPATLPGNIAKAENVLKLQERWVCNKRQESCVGVHCYVNPDPPNQHIPLNHEWLDCWASAMMKGEEHATEESPPNHRLFNLATTAPSRSPVLQCHINAQQNKNSPPTAPVFNLTIGSDITNRFFPPAAQAPAPPTAAASSTLAPAAIINSNSYDLQCPTILQPSCAPGVAMPLAEFCNKYDLSNTVLQKLSDNSYNSAQVLRFVTVDELKAMDFRMGEVAAFRDAVEQWSVPCNN
ncbi:hypothetical protein DXG01_016784 [Tephrocybe rancida]|nr:hypothetical protein DXG01_016784 [Tephrocybe rancida]